MAGLRTSVFISVVSFLLGLLFTHWIADSLTLWKPPSKQTDLQLWTSATYYSVLSRMPAPVAYFYMAIVALGGATLFWSFSDGRAGNLMFDGGSASPQLWYTCILCYQVCTTNRVFVVRACVYARGTDFFANFTSLPLPFNSPTPELPVNSHPPSFPPFPQSLRAPTLDLASSHLICSVALTGVLALQAGRWWAEQADIDEDDEDEMIGGEEAEDAKLRTRESSPAFVDADKKQK